MTALPPPLPRGVRKLTIDDAALAAMLIVQNTGVDLITALNSLGISIVSTEYFNRLIKMERDYNTALHTPKSMGGLSET